MRLGFDGLATKVVHALKLDPYSGNRFVFRTKNGTRLKVLAFDGIDWWLRYRRLEQGSLVWRAGNERGVIELSNAEFVVLAQELDWRRARIPQPIVATIAYVSLT